MNLRLAPALAIAVIFASCSTTSGPVPAANKQGVSFNTFYTKLRKEAIAKGYDASLLDDAYEGKPAPIAAVTKSESAQPELIRTFAQYTGSMLSSTRIQSGIENMQEHQEDLLATQTRSGVSASVVVALWGIETNFGKVQGDHPVIPALVTLAWESPRADYFRKETFAALEVVRKTGKKPNELKGSWAGAMGQCQFMPSSYLAYGTDGNNDGVADIWSTEADVFASAATYLQKRGWRKDLPWRLPVNDAFKVGSLKLNTRGLSEPHPLSFYQAKGFKLPTGTRINAAEKFRYYKPQEDGPAHLLGPNFSVILSWNNSSYFAWSVLALADVIEQQSQVR